MLWVLFWSLCLIQCPVQTHQSVKEMKPWSSYLEFIIFVARYVTLLLLAPVPGSALNSGYSQLLQKLLYILLIKWLRWSEKAPWLPQLSGVSGAGQFSCWIVRPRFQEGPAVRSLWRFSMPWGGWRYSLWSCHWRRVWDGFSSRFPGKCANGWLCSSCRPRCLPVPPFPAASFLWGFVLSCLGLVSRGECWKNIERMWLNKRRCFRDVAKGIPSKPLCPSGGPGTGESLKNEVK